MRLIELSLFFCLSAAALMAQTLPTPLSDADYRPVNPAEARLGQQLFYDPVLSGNQTVACATCHHPKFGTSDGLSLSFGDGGIGLGPERHFDPENIPEKRIPRNAPALFNLGAYEFTVMFHDGRLEQAEGHPNGIRTPLDNDMLEGFVSVLSAQTMFPVLSRDEMAGSYAENPVAALVRQGRITGKGGAWDLLSARVAAIPVYSDQFVSVYPHIGSPKDITFADISNAIAAFMEFEWRSDSAPFDGYLDGTLIADPVVARGISLFYGEAGCSDCHSGAFLTDHSFHAMGDPQIGPGKSATFETHFRDDGRIRVTGDPTDQYAFRTPSLRNVALTAPYGHAGAYQDLKAYLKHHINPVAGLRLYDPENARLPPFEVKDFVIMMSSAAVEEIAATVERPALDLSEAQIDDLVAFLESLTDPIAIEGRLGVPTSVPSGLPVP